MAAGQTIADFAAFDLDLPDQNYPLPYRIDGREMLRFGSAATQTAYTRPRFMPRGVSGSTRMMTVRLCWKANASDPTSSPSAVRWKIALEAYTSALNGESFGIEKIVMDSPFTTIPHGPGSGDDEPRPNRARYTDITFTFTEADSILAHEMFRVRITRESFTGTMAVDAELLGVLVFES